MSDYPQKHVDRGISYSALKRVMVAPALYEWQYIQGNWPPVTDAILLGRAVDCLTLEPERFKERFVAAPEGVDKKSKAGKAIFADLAATKKDVLRHRQLVTAQACATAARARRVTADGPTLEEILARPDTLVQQELDWVVQPDDGGPPIKCQGKADVIAAGGTIIIDVKKVGQQGEASPAQIGKTIGKYLYDIQAAMYLDGARAKGWDPQQYLVWAVEEPQPHLCGVHPLGLETLETADRAYRHAVWLWRTCVETGRWPGYEMRLHDVGIPMWAKKEREITREGE